MESPERPRESIDDLDALLRSLPPEIVEAVNALPDRNALNDDATSGLSPYLQYFVEKMMAKDKDVRYQSWEELTGDIRGQLEGRDKMDFRSGPAASGRRPGPPPARGRRR